MSNRIHELRLNQKLTLLQVADSLKVSESTVQRYESGNIKNLKYETMIKLAELFGVSPCYLMGWEDDPSEPLSDPDAPFIAKYKRLDHEDKTRVQERVDTLLEQDKYQKGLGADQVG